MDYYLNTQNSYDRLLAEYRQHGSLVVAYDFDNTVYDFHQKGWRFDKVIHLLRQLKEIGCYLIIFTANQEEDFVKNYCQKNDIPFDSLNENPPFFKSNSRKIYYNILLDDRAGLKESYTLLSNLIKNLK